MRRWVTALVLALVVAGAAVLLGGVMRHSSSDTGRQPSSRTSPQPANQVLFADDFDGSTLDDSRWNTCHWWGVGGCTIASNDEEEWYVPSQVSVADGRLRLTADARPTTAPDGTRYDYRSGMVSTGPADSDRASPKSAFTYGRVEVRLRVPRGRGLWPAVWMLPADRSSRPEIDLLEVMGQRPSRIDMHLHPRNRSRPSHAGKATVPDLSRGWHTVRLDWAPGDLRWYVDGTQVWRVSGRDVPAQPMYLVLNLAVGGVYPGPPTRETRFPATFEVDDVRVTRSAS